MCVPTAATRGGPPASPTRLAHIGLVCDDLDETRKSLEDKGVHFLVDGIADTAGVRTTWSADPWGVVFTFVEMGRPERPYFAQFG